MLCLEVKEVDLEMIKKKPTPLLVDEKFKAIIKAEAALNGKSVFQFTRDLASEERLFSNYLEEDVKGKGLKRRGGFGFRF